MTRRTAEEAKTSSGPKHATQVRIRLARAEEGERIREIARTSKGHWGYDSQLIDSWVSGLDLSPEGLRKKEYYACEVGGLVVGWSAIIPKGQVCWLDDVWIDPEYIGKGIGTKMFEHAVARGRALGAARVELEAERHSVGFYRKMGARYVRDSEPGVWGRISPIMALEIRDKALS